MKTREEIFNLWRAMPSNGAIVGCIEEFYLASRADGIEESEQAADKIRLTLSLTYQERLVSGQSEMNGNMGWARLEGSVRTVQAIRALKEPK